MKRIGRYFKCFNNYTGKISVELSAGYDTTQISTISHKIIEHFKGFNNINDHDKGYDDEISKIIAKRLEIKLNFIE